MQGITRSAECYKRDPEGSARKEASRFDNMQERRREKLQADRAMVTLYLYQDKSGPRTELKILFQVTDL